MVLYFRISDTAQQVLHHQQLTIIVSSSFGAPASGEPSQRRGFQASPVPVTLDTQRKYHPSPWSGLRAYQVQNTCFIPDTRKSRTAYSSWVVSGDSFANLSRSEGAKALAWFHVVCENCTDTYSTDFGGSGCELYRSIPPRVDNMAVGAHGRVEARVPAEQQHCRLCRCS